MAKAFDARHLSNNKTYEIQGSNHFEVIIPGMGDEFTLCISTCNLPEVTIAAVELNYGNSKVKVAGTVELGDGSLTVKDAIVADIEKKISDWQNLVYNKETGKMGWAYQYKKDLQVNQYGPDGTYVRTWVLQGAWPTSVSYGEMDYSSGEKKQITMTIAYDNAKLKR